MFARKFSAATNMKQCGCAPFSARFLLHYFYIVYHQLRLHPGEAQQTCRCEIFKFNTNILIATSWMSKPNFWDSWYRFPWHGANNWFSESRFSVNRFQARLNCVLVWDSEFGFPSEPPTVWNANAISTNANITISNLIYADGAWFTAQISHYTTIHCFSLMVCRKFGNVRNADLTTKLGMPGK